MKSKSLFNSSKWRVGNPLFDELRAQKYVQIRKICPKFCIFNRRKSVENELFRCLIGAINRHFPTPKWPDLPCFLAKGSRKSFAGQISGRATVAPVKNDDFGGVFHPLAGKLFSAAKRESCSRKHSLLFALCKYLLPARGQNIERAAVKRGKDGFISVGIVHEAKIPTYSITCAISDYATCVHFDATRGHSGKRAYNPCF